MPYVPPTTRATSEPVTVWSSSKTAYDYTGAFSPMNDFDALREAEGDNFFSIKVNYYLNP